MIKQKIQALSSQIDSEASFGYYEKLQSLDENFRRYLTPLFGDEHQKRIISLYFRRQTNTIVLELDADSCLHSTKEIIFVLIEFLEEHYPSDYPSFYTISLEWC